MKKVLLASALAVALASTSAFAASYSKIVTIEDWGASIPKLVVDMGQEVSSASADDFAVYVKRSDSRMETPLLNEGTRPVTNAYVSDAEGNAVEAGQYVTLEMPIGPTVSLGSALNYTQGSNVWIDYEVAIYDKCTGEVITECTGEKRLEIENFETAKGTFDGVEMSYAYYIPEDTSAKKPLIIWLHGGGEGGTDATIPLAANRAVSFASEHTQEIFGGAYVLAPQAPTKWMAGVTADRDGTSIYTKAVMEMIEKFVAENNVDANRIYVGGCSNGGYMTMVLAREYPEYFAAYYPICEGLYDTLVTDEDVNTYKDLAMWFVFAGTDTTLDPIVYTMPTYIRIKEAGAENVHCTMYPNVVDKSGLYTKADGTAHEYNGHWSWIYLYNDDVHQNINGENVGLLSWMAAQSK